MTRPMTLARERDGIGRLVAWGYRRAFSARTWGEALHLAVAEAHRNVLDAHVVATPSHTTPTGRLSVKVFVRRCSGADCKFCED